MTRKLNFLFQFSFAAAILFFGQIAKATPPAGYYLVWADEFNGTSLDTTKWDYWLLGGRRDAVNIQNAVAVGGGNLTITTYTSNNVHYTAMIATDGTFRSRYGYWESSIKWGDTNGMWSAFWMQSPTMGTYLFDPAVSGSELDFAEHRFTDGGSVGDINNIVQNNIHWNGYGTDAKSAGSGNITTGGNNLGSGFHAYGFLWTPGTASTSVYTLFVDGQNLRSWNFQNNAVPISQSTEWTILSSEVDDTSTTWAGTIPPAGYGSLATSTTKLTVDYVRYYAPTNVLFWLGANSAYLTNSANWISNLPPVSTSDLTFSSLSGNNLSPMLGQDFSVDSLVFLNMNNGASVNGTNTLTLGAGGIDMVAANHSITINCPVNIGTDQKWLVGPNSPGNTLTVNGNISGFAALTKGSYGILILNGTNGFSGMLNVDTGISGSSGQNLSDGAVRITRSENIANAASPIQIRNNNTGSSTLQLDGTLGNIIIPQSISLSGRNTNIVAIENLSGSNTVFGGLTINSGGGFYLLQSDAGTLNFGGTILAGTSATGTRTLTFQGAGNFYISGSIQNGSATINIAKTNLGTLTFSGLNTFSGSTTNWRGNLFVNGTLANSLTVVGGTISGSGTIGGATVIQSGAMLSPGNAIGTLNFGNNLTLSPGSTNIIEINKMLRTNDIVKVIGVLSYGGTLIITNFAGNLTSGDSFKIFNAGSYAGSFSTLKLPALDFGLAWNTNSLTNGILSVVATVAPQFKSIAQQNDGNFIFSGAGASWATYELDAATNLLSPIIWAFVANTLADVNGNFQVADLQATNFPQRFYRIIGNQ